MKKYLLALFSTLLFAILAQAPAFATWTHVQDAYHQNASGTVSSVAVTSGSSVTAGNLVVVSVQSHNASSSTVSIADSGSNTWYQLENNASNLYSSSLFYSVITTGGTLTITATVAAASTPAISMAEYSFTAGTVFASRVSASAYQATGTSVTCPSLDFGASSALAVCGINSGSATTATAGTGFTMRESVVPIGGASEGLSYQDNVGVSSSPVTVGATMSGSSITIAAAAVFVSTGDMPSTGWSWEQGTLIQGGAGGVTSLAKALPSPVAVGDLVTVHVSNYTVADVVSVSDSGSNTWTKAASQTGGAVGTSSYIFYSVITTGGILTITTNFTVTDFPSVAISEYKATAGTLSNPGANFGAATSATPSAGAVTFSSTKALLLGNMCSNNAVTFTPASGFTLRTNGVYVSGSAEALPVEEYLNATSTPTTVNGTIVSSVPWGMSAAAFQSSGDTSGVSSSASPSTSTNAQTVTYTITGTSTSWTSGTTFSISGVTGASITSQSCNAGTQVGTVAVLLDNTHTGTLTFTDSTDAASCTSTVTLAAPGVPASPSCTAGNNQNVLNWSAPSSGGLVATYNVYRGTSPSGESGTPLASGLTALTYTDSTAVNGTTYYYTIKSVNSTGTSAASTEVSGEPEPGASFTVSPSTNANATTVTYTITGTGTSWTSGTTFNISGVTGASITSQSCNSGTQVGTVAVLLDNTHTGTLSFTDSTDSASATSAVTLAAPGIPTSVSCSPGNHQNIINWSAGSGGAPATYTLLRSLSSGTETSYQAGLTGTSYTDTGLTNSTTYYYKVEAVNGTGTSSASSEVSGTPAVQTTNPGYGGPGFGF